MGKAATSKSTVTSDNAPSGADTPQAVLEQFRWPDTAHPGFTVARHWWAGEGAREGIAPWVRKKLAPGSDPNFGRAAKAEVLLPGSAPSDYADMDFLLRRCDETLPPFVSHAMFHVKIAWDSSEPWHASYERSRAFARGHFADRFPVILVAHVPNVAGLNGFGSHAHCIVIPRPVGINGFAGACGHLCSDRGYSAALSAWQEHLEGEQA